MIYFRDLYSGLVGAMGVERGLVAGGRGIGWEASAVP